MATYIKGGQRTWSGVLDATGHRTYKIAFQTEGSFRDGPANHLQTPGLPLPGSWWLVDDDIDIWAYCDGSDQCTPRQKEGEKNFLFDHVFNFTSKPYGSGGGGDKPGNKDPGSPGSKGAQKKCADQKIEDPLLEPPSTSGGTVKYQEEAYEDKDGKPLRYTSFEQIRGPAITFDRGRATVTVSQNVPALELDVVNKMRDTVSDAPLWDLPARCWKLSDFTWDRKLYGICNFYYTRRFVFEANVRKLLDDPDDPTAGFHIASGWDRDVLDESSKVLNGTWLNVPLIGWVWKSANLPGGIAPDKDNPNHYINYRDKNGNAGRTVLSFAHPGEPIRDKDDANYIFVQYYQESNFLDLGIPTSL